MTDLLRKRLRGEVAPNYMIHPYAAERAWTLLPQAKIIVLLRNPIQRALSSFNMKWQIAECGARAWQMADCFRELGRTDEELAADWSRKMTEFLQAELHVLEKCYRGIHSNYYRTLFDCLDMKSLNSIDLHLLLENDAHLARGIYVDQLENWMRFYGPDRFLVLSSEDFEANPLESMHRVSDFLQIDQDDWKPQAFGYRHHVREYPIRDPERIQNLPVIRELRRFYATHNQRLFQLLRSTGHESSLPSLEKYFAQ